MKTLLLSTELLTKEEAKTFASLMSKVTKKVTTEFMSGEDLKQTIRDTFSYEELVAVVDMFTAEKTLVILDQNPLFTMLVQLRRDIGEEIKKEHYCSFFYFYINPLAKPSLIYSRCSYVFSYSEHYISEV